MTAEYLPDQPEELNLANERPDFAFMSTAQAYDLDSDIARQRRSAFLRALPPHIHEDHIEKLSKEVFWSAHDQQQTSTENEQLALLQRERAGRAAELRFLGWLGNVTLQVDDVTAKNTQEVMWRRHGLRGKLGALSLKFKQFTQY